jgi:hypothetical protein
MITDSSGIAKGEGVTTDAAPTEAATQDLFNEGIDPREKHLGTDHLLADLKGRTISGAFITIAAQGAQFSFESKQQECRREPGISRDFPE